MADKLKPNTKEWNQRQARHRHNGFFGSVAMTKAQMRSIIDASTTTPQAKRVASDILCLAGELGLALKTRIDR